MTGGAAPDALPSTRSIVAGRFGFWLGAALFALLLWAGPPESMRIAAYERIVDEQSAAITGLLDARGQSDAPTHAPEFAQAKHDAIELRAWRMHAAAAVTVLVACWWIFGALPIAATSLLPIVLFPILGVLPIEQATAPYANHNVFLFLGGFIIALGIERWGLHKRVALHVVLIVGTRRTTVVLGFMIASALLSMWISNTATTMMMLPIGLAVIGALEALDGSGSERERGNFAAALMLGTAYGASVGGVATPIGTPPNIVFRGQVEALLPGQAEIGFGLWMLIFVPLVLILLPLIWLVLVRVTCRVSTGEASAGRGVIRAELGKLGVLSGPERTMLVVFASTALLWMTRSIPVGADNYGWAALLEGALGSARGGTAWFAASNISDATVAMTMALLLFALPGDRDQRGRRRRLMDWKTAERLPWGILLLFGGGFAIAAAFKSTGLSHWAGQLFSAMGAGHPLSFIAGTCGLMTFLTEVTSNTATTQIMLPVIAHVSEGLGVHPLLLMLAATVSASCAFMLPVATPPNAIVFGSGRISMGRMLRTGILLNLIGIVVVTAVLYLIAAPLLGI